MRTIRTGLLALFFFAAATTTGCSCGSDDSVFGTGESTTASTGAAGTGGAGAAGSATGTGAAGGAGSGGAGGTGGAGTNTPPAVVLPPDRTVLIDSTVTLDGAATDPDPGDVLSLTWTQQAGTAVTIAGPTANPTTFVAAAPVGDVLTFELRACDLANACASDTISFTVTDVLDTYVARPPVGSNMAGDGSMQKPWETVSRGVSVGAGVVAGTITARVHVQAGVYDENVVMADGVSILGGYDASWNRDPALNPTTVRANNRSGLRYVAGGSYTRPTELDGLILELDPTGIGAPDLSTLTIEEGQPAIRNTIVRLAVAPSIANGIAVSVPAGSSANVLLQDVTVEAGDVVDPNGVVVGLAASGAGSKAVTATLLNILHPMTTKRRHYGIDLDGGQLSMDNSSVAIADATAPAAITPDETCGVRLRSASVATVQNSTIDPGGGFQNIGGICLFSASSVTLDGAQVSGGDAVGPANIPSTSSALSLDTDATANLTNTALSGGSVTLGMVAGAHRSYGINAAVRAKLTVTGGTIDAGPGDWGIGVRLFDPTVATFTGTQVNASNNLMACTNARRCIGIWVDGRDGPVGAPQSPQTAPFSCCDPAQYGVVIEGGRIVGGNGSESTGLLVTGGGMLLPGACANGTVIDAGNCPAGNISTGCRGADITVAADLLLHNSTIYGGTGVVTVGARVFSGTGAPQLANNYIHGGNPIGGLLSTTSTGLFFVNGKSGTGWRILNNIIDGGTGNTRYGAFEENHNSDPGRFQNNNVVMASPGGMVKSVLYRNCTPTTCAQEFNTVAEIDTQLTINGQTTFGQGGTLSNPNCLVNPMPRGGDVHQAAGSACINAGLERNQSCNICQTPWSDAFGVDRLVQGWTLMPAPCSQNGPTMTGDGMPDIGPGEN